MDFLFASGFRRVVLAGHGLGARKAAYYLAERLDPRVVGLVAASPIVLKHPGGAQTEEDRTLLTSARAMASTGRGRDLLPWPPEGCSMSAATHVDHEDPDAPFSNLFALTGHAGRRRSRRSIKIPILAFFGSEERSSDGRDRGGGARAPPAQRALVAERHDHADPRRRLLVHRPSQRGGRHPREVRDEPAVRLRRGAFDRLRAA